MYGKLIDGAIRYAPNPIKTETGLIFTSDPTPYGYKKVVTTTAPNVDDGYIAYSKWVQSEEAITQTWYTEKDTLTKPKTQEERIADLESENEKLKEENQTMIECILEMSELVYA